MRPKAEQSADLPLRGRCRRQKGCISIGRQPGRLVFPFARKGGCEGFIIRGGLLRCKMHPLCRLLATSLLKGSVSLDSQSPKGFLRIQFPCHPICKKGEIVRGETYLPPTSCRRQTAYILRRSRHLPLSVSEHNPSTQPAAAGGPNLCRQARPPIFYCGASRHHNPQRPMAAVKPKNPPATGRSILRTVPAFQAGTWPAKRAIIKF